MCRIDTLTRFQKVLAQATDRESWEKRTNEGAVSTANAEIETLFRAKAAVEETAVEERKEEGADQEGRVDLSSSSPLLLFSLLFSSLALRCVLAISHTRAMSSHDAHHLSLLEHE